MIASLTGQGFDVQRACLMPVRSGKSIRTRGGTYGTLRITAELRYGRGIHVGKEQVQLLMKRLGIYGLPKRRVPRGAKVG